MEFTTYLDRMAEVSGRKDKEQLVEDMLKAHLESEEFLRLVFDDTKYGISDKVIQNALQYNPLYHGTFPDSGMMCFKLCKGEQEMTMKSVNMHLEVLKQTSGDQQTGYLRGILTTYKPSDCQWFVNCLTKNLRNGVSLSTSNNVFHRLNLPIVDKFMVQLCGSFKNVEDYDKGFPVAVSKKYDGMRLIINKSEDKIIMTTRQGEVVYYLPEFIEYFKTYDFDFIIDGEVMMPTFSELQKRINRKAENIEPMKGLHFRVYDILKLQNENFVSLPYSVRASGLKKLFKETEMLKIEETILAHNIRDIEKFYNDIIEDGGEGVVIKLLERSYDYDSRKNWFKIKTIFDATVKVTGYTDGTGKFSNTVGALYIEDKNGVIKSKVGSGLTDDDRVECMRKINNSTLDGCFIDIEFNEVTQNKKGDFSLRHPRFIKFREDKSEADIIEIPSKLLS